MIRGGQQVGENRRFLGWRSYAYKCWFMGWGKGTGECLVHKLSRWVSHKWCEGPTFRSIWLNEPWQQGEEWGWGWWFFRRTGVFPTRTTSASTPQSYWFFLHSLLLTPELTNPAFWGQIEMPECMEINHRIIQTAAYQLPYIWHNYPTSNMKMLYCNNSKPEEKAALLITWESRRIQNRSLRKL